MQGLPEGVAFFVLGVLAGIAPETVKIGKSGG